MVTSIVSRFAAVLAVAAALGCGVWPSDDPPPVVVLGADYSGILEGGRQVFETLATSGVTPVTPATARLVGPTYGVAFDAVGTSRRFDGTVFAQAAYGLLPEDVGRDSRGEHRAAEGHEFVLAHVPAGEHLPEPERGYGTLFTGWQVDVGGTVRPLVHGNDRDTIAAGSIVVVSVPIGAEARLGATVDGRTKWVSLRTGRPR
ncbi:hypothetical protein Drose_19215 [Dactylosporangium roseum]|uniref:Uncharacterized protein n=1 Tax=Dactylosporangium roseum TaxID=47989 RepID=A0ABY5YVA9_9ACTN|nr:hypothetical protein [Dactylosporangium roseum]UWZ33452.1 hypothetical protein Drose_19215 [Dactylosporangium roseum]